MTITGTYPHRVTSIIIPFSVPASSAAAQNVELQSKRVYPRGGGEDNLRFSVDSSTKQFLEDSRSVHVSTCGQNVKADIKGHQGVVHG